MPLQTTDNSTFSAGTPQTAGLQPATAPAPPSPEAIQQALKSLVDDSVKNHIEVEKVYQYAQVRKTELYWRGNQYVYPILLGGNVVDYTSTGDLQYNMTPDEMDTLYDYVFNVIRGDGMKFVAVLGQQAPNVKALCRREDDEAAARRTRRADLASNYLRTLWSPDKLHRQLAMSLWKNGTTFAYTPWVANDQKYGRVREVQIDVQTVPFGSPYYECQFCGSITEQAQAQGPQGPRCSMPECGQPFQPTDLKQPTMQMPMATGEKYYPKGSVECYYASIFEVTTPFYVKDLRETPWLWYEYEEFKGNLLQAYPTLADTMQDDIWEGDNSGVSSSGQLARDIASSPTGSYITPRKDRWLYQRFWLRPSMFQLVRDETMKRHLLTNFPQGVRVAIVNDKVVDVYQENLSDVWSMCKSSPSEYIYSDPVCYDYLPVQDLVNDLYNITAEALERAIPYLIVDPMVIDVVQLSKQRGKPAQMVPARAGVGARLQDSIFKPPVSSVDPQIIQWQTSIREAGRELVGIIPAMFGGGEQPETAEAARIQKAQALQQLNPVWNEMREFWAQTYTNAVRQLAKHALPDGSNLGMADGGQFEDGEADFTDLLSGGWYFDADQNMPETWGQKRDMMMFLLQEAPQAGELLGINHPLNVGKIQEALGLVGWKVTNVDKREKVLATIQLLKRGQPIPDPAGGPPQPSIPPDVFEDDHMFTASVVKEWAQTEEARALRDSNPMGYQNVIAWAQAHLQLSGPPPMPGGPPGAGSPPTPGGDAGAPMPGQPLPPTPGGPQGPPPGAAPGPPMPGGGPG